MIFMWNNQLIHTTGLISQPVEQENYQWGYMLSCCVLYLNIVILECDSYIVRKQTRKKVLFRQKKIKIVLFCK